MVAITHADIYTFAVCKRIGDIYAEEAENGWDDSWHERAGMAETAFVESLPAYQERERQREAESLAESIAEQLQLDAEEEQNRLAEFAYFGLDRELTDAEHEAISQSFHQYI